MNRRQATTTVAAALGLAVAGGATVGHAQMMKDPKAETMQRMAQGHLEKCFGVAARGRNDCAQGAHSCAGQATRDRDPGSFILLPAGDCSKIAGSKSSAT